MCRKPRVGRSPEEKWQIVPDGIKSGNVSKTCRRDGIAPNLLYRCRDEAAQGAKAALGGEALPRRKSRRTIVSGSWNDRWGGKRWRSKSLKTSRGGLR